MPMGVEGSLERLLLGQPPQIDESIDVKKLRTNHDSIGVNIDEPVIPEGLGCGDLSLAQVHVKEITFIAELY